MKRKLLLALTLLLSVTMVACGSSNTADVDSSNLSVEELQERIEELEEENQELEEALEKYESQNENESEASSESNLSVSINETNAEDWGICGENLMWYYKNDILVIHGTGVMTDFGANEAPWWELNPVKVIIEEGCTHIGRDAFGIYGEKGFDRGSNLTSIVIPDSVTSIGEGAFQWTSNLNSVTLRGATYTQDTYEEAFINAGITVEE